MHGDDAPLRGVEDACAFAANVLAAAAAAAPPARLLCAAPALRLGSRVARTREDPGGPFARFDVREGRDVIRYFAVRPGPLGRIVDSLLLARLLPSFGAEAVGSFDCVWVDAAARYCSKGSQVALTPAHAVHKAHSCV